MSKYDLGPCDLPQPNPLVSFWLSESNDLASHRTTDELPQDADVIIIGSGVSGTMTAYRLLERDPSLKILMVEAREVCGGATGRNGGQIKTDPYVAYETLRDLFGAERANEVLRFESSHLDMYLDLVCREQIKCDLHVTSAFDVALNESMAKIARQAYHARKADFPNDMKAFMELEDLEHLARLSGVKNALWGCMYRVGSIHPYKLVNGLLRKCFERSKAAGGYLNLQTFTPVDDIDHADGRWSITTERGSASAPKLVVACNAYVSHLLPEFANKVIPVRGPCSSLAIPPQQPSDIPSLEVMRPLFTTYSLKNTPHDYDYMISRQEGQKNIVVGGGHAAFEHLPEQWYGNVNDTEQIPGTEEYFKAFMPKNFINYPEPESRLDLLWTGIMALSSDGIPWVGAVPDRPHGIYMLGGFHGRGMVRAPRSVEALVALITSDAQGEAGQKVLVEAGLPRAFVLTKERLALERNIITEDFDHETDGEEVGALVDAVKAAL